MTRIHVIIMKTTYILYKENSKACNDKGAKPITAFSIQSDSSENASKWKITTTNRV